MRVALGWMLLALASAAHAQIPHETLYDGLYGPDIVQAIRSELAPATRGYGPARDSMYTWEQRTYGRLRCVYSGFEITIPLGAGRDASTEAFNRGINAEHTWPQSMGAGNEPERSDLHNLFPTRDAVNSARGNLPFGESPDHLTTAWYRGTASQTSLPLVALDQWSERQGSARFEPREDHKGNAARAALYFYARWPAASTAYLQGQVADLVAWSEADPVDADEWARMTYVASLQGNRNPFVVDPGLARRTFLPGVVAGEAPPVPAGIALSAPWPTPAAHTATIRVDGPAGVSVRLSAVDALGREVWAREGAAGAVALPVRQWAPGVYAVRAEAAGRPGAARRLVVAR